MSNQQNYTEMIDAYLTGQLNQEDSTRLMERLEQDSALKDEFLLQQDMIHSLQAHRRNELKARLNNIEVGNGASYTGAGALKMVAGAALVALIGTGIYFTFNDGGAVKENEIIRQVEITTLSSGDLPSTKLPEIPEAKIPAQTEPTSDQLLTEELNKKSNTLASGSEKPAEEINKIPKEAPATEEAIASTEVDRKAAEKADVVKPDVISFFDDQDPSANHLEADSPEDKLNAGRSFNTQNIEVTTVTDNRYSFHYMFFNNQLHIYGDFSKVPYEVLEVNSGNHTRYYLYHNSSYYELNPNQRKITRLKDLNDESIIKELEITRNEKMNR